MLCNYNHGRYLPQCLAGLLRQTFTDFEIVVTDDGSTDDSVSIIREFAEKDPRFQPVYFAQNRGVLAATEDVFNRSRGKYLFGQGADDFIFDANFFARAVAALESYPSAAGFYGISAIYSDERKQAINIMGSAPTEGFIAPEPFIKGFLRGEVFVPGSSSIWRAEHVKGFGGYDVSFGPQTDYFVNHALPFMHGIVFEKTPFTGMRVYDTGSNYGSKGTLWEAVARFAQIEKRLRELVSPYDGMEDDWRIWRARSMVESILKTGIKMDVGNISIR
jgi:glycosyltransferase involved in cell wall biosynthesis